MRRNMCRCRDCPHVLHSLVCWGGGGGGGDAVKAKAPVLRGGVLTVHPSVLTINGALLAVELWAIVLGDGFLV